MATKTNYSFEYMIEQIKENIDIREIAEEYLDLNKQGMCCCPFHGERKPSFSVSSKKKIFKCFSCGVGGDVITLYAKLNHISNGQAIHQLGSRLGLSIGRPLPKPLVRKYAQDTKDKKLEREFLRQHQELFYDLCTIRDMMNVLAKQYEFIEDMEEDDLLIQYYHERAHQEYLLDGLLKGVLEEIGFEQQIEFFLTAREVLNRWVKHLRKRCE